MSASTSPRDSRPPSGTGGALEGGSAPGRTATRFELPGYRGALAEPYRGADLEALVRRLTDPACARETLHWGRNYLYAARLDSAGGGAEVVVKQFRNQGRLERWRRRRRGSKAAASWRMAVAMSAAGVATPEPVALIESTAAEGPSWFVTRRLEGFFESRYLFRALRQGRRRDLFPWVDERVFFTDLGRYLRRFHDAGLWHRDITVGNLLVRYEKGDGAHPSFYLVDLNRGRVGARLGLSRRTRDLCRLPLLERRHRDAVLAGYWGKEVSAASPERLLHLLYSGAFRARNRLKDLIRRPLRAAAGLLFPRRAHVHIPPAPLAASLRDKVVWDPLSDQPHQHAGRFERLVVRVADSGIHLRSAAAGIGATPRIWRRYRQLRAGLYREPVPWGGVGVALRPGPMPHPVMAAALEDLGVRRVMMRLHPWQEDHHEEEALARELHARGFELGFSLPQNRDLVREPERWRRAVETIAGRFLPLGRHFQIGQAINRSKWGVWNHGEYLELAATASEVLRRAGDVEILGPAVIDFELHAVAAVLNLGHPGVRFDVVSSLLYVDRRGAPENRQLGFDTVDKVVLLRAIADTARSGCGRCWITEVNWPLREGPHSPAGRKVAVDEETQANYLVRYYLLALTTGLVERVYWWQLAARGYGLVDPTAEGRRRPAFQALSHMVRQLRGGRFVRPLAAGPGARLLLFETGDGAELAVGWSPDGLLSVRLPRPAREVLDRDGRALATPAGTELELGPSPRYVRF